MNTSKLTSKLASTRFQIFFIVSAVFILILSRFYGLSFKPLHFDEGINGWFSTQVQEVGYYKYDPNNYHGPLYFYILRFFEILFGKSILTLRLVPTFFGLLSVIFFMVSRWNTSVFRNTLVVLFLSSPAFIFFGRSGIHEMPFVFFQILFAVGLLSSVEQWRGKSMALMLVGLFGVAMLKETFVLTGLSFVVGLCFLGYRGLSLWLKDFWSRTYWNKNLTSLFIFLLLFFILIFSGAFRNPEGLVDFFRAFIPWMKTGVQGNGHDKVFSYWLQTLLVAEPLVLFGAVMAFIGVFSKSPSLRVISVFSLFQFLIYSVIPYKTVWCVLSLVWGFYFVLAYWMEFLKTRPVRWVFIFFLAGGICFNVLSALRSSYRKPIDFTHPYVYVNSTESVTEVMSLLESTPSSKTARFQVGMSEQWPWPWLLRDFNVASYESCSKSLLEDLDVYFCDPDAIAGLEKKLKEPYWKIEFIFRQEKGTFSYLYLRQSSFPKVPWSQAHIVKESL